MGIFRKRKKREEDTYIKTYPDKVIYTRILAYLKPYKRDITLLIIMLIIVSVTGMAYPIGMPMIVNLIEDVGEVPNETIMRDAWIIGGFLFLAVLLNFLAKRAYQYNINKLGQYVLNDIRSDLFEHIQTLSLEFYSGIPTGKLMSRLTNDVDTIQSLVSNSLIQIIGDLLVVISTFAIMIWSSWELTMIIVICAPIFMSVFVFFGRKSRTYWRKQRRTIAEITSIIQESVSGVRTIKAFVTEDQNIENFDAANRANRQIAFDAAKLNAFLQPIVQIFTAIVIGFVVFLGAELVRGGRLDLSILILFVMLATQFLNPFNNLGNFYNNAQQSLSAGDRILLILDEKPTVADNKEGNIMPPIQGKVEYRDVSFEYVENVPVLDHISFSTNPGERYAFVGFTGAGKSTLISLLSRFYDPTKGQILIDGEDIRNVTLNSLRSQMGIVLQDTFLFSGTVMENIRYGKLDATDEEVIEAAQRVGAHAFVLNLPDGYETDVRERGGLLSVGQRQLISFARALLANPPILILDEATSSVDPYTELKIQEALEVLLEGRNSFLIAHRLSTILNSDVICVMENGKIIQRGSHDELIDQGGLYKHLYEMQFKKSENRETLDDKLS